MTKPASDPECVSVQTYAPTPSGSRCRPILRFGLSQLGYFAPLVGASASTGPFPATGGPRTGAGVLGTTFSVASGFADLWVCRTDFKRIGRVLCANKDQHISPCATKLEGVGNLKM